MRRIALITGGSTAERSVALAGARQVAAALRSRGFQVSVVDTASGALSARQERERLLESVGAAPPTEAELAQIRRDELGPRLVELPELRAAELIFLVLHGAQGEDGQIQALLDLAGLLYTGTGPLGSALAMNKDVSKRLCRDAGIPTADWRLWPLAPEEADRLGYPLVVKPSSGGSSVGLSVAESYHELEAAVADALAEDQEVLVERFLPGRELTVGILDDSPLAVGEIITDSGIFDYHAKYTPGGAREIFPAEIPASLATQVRQLGLATHRLLKLRDFSRVDFRLSTAGEPLVLEANTLPGFTATSLLPQSAAVFGIGFAELCSRICELAWRRGPVAESAGRPRTVPRAVGEEPSPSG